MAENIVLVHGAYADGSSWAKVIAILQKAGKKVIAVQHPLTTLEAGVEIVKRTLDEEDGPTVLVAHSFAGMIISETGIHPNVSALVYVAARAPDAGEDFPALAAEYPTPPASSGLVWKDGFGKLGEEAFLKDFAGDVPTAEAEVLFAAQGPVSDTLFKGKTTQAAWREKPSWYAVSTEDRTISPDLERFMAKRMNAKTIELPSSHVSLVSHPEEIAQLILEAADAEAR